jgi:hypothetical protein
MGRGEYSQRGNSERESEYERRCVRVTRTENAPDVLVCGHHIRSELLNESGVKVWLRDTAKSLLGPTDQTMYRSYGVVQWSWMLGLDCVIASDYAKRTGSVPHSL